MITCFIKYVIDPSKIDAFEECGRHWIRLVGKFGGEHLGYYLPHEGSNNIAYALFNFKSLSYYELYRIQSKNDLDCQKAYEYAKTNKCIIGYKRTFMKPIL